MIPFFTRNNGFVFTEFLLVYRKTLNLVPGAIFAFVELKNFENSLGLKMEFLGFLCDLVQILLVQVQKLSL